MWARVVEVMLACWLAIGPFALRHPQEARDVWLNDLLCAAAVACFALLGFWPRAGRLHLLVGLVGLWLVAFGFLATPPPVTPASQNHILVGLLLMMLAIVPNHADLPPAAWRDYEGRPE